MKKKLSMVLVVIIFASVLIFAKTQGYLAGAENLTFQITSPVTLFFSQASHRFTSFFGGLFSLGKLQKENGTLRDQLNQLQAEVAQLSEAKKENEKLRQDLGFVKATNFSYEPVEVISYDPSNLRGAVVINKGSKDGLKVGMAAITEGFLAGRVIEVSENTAKVKLITDPDSAIPVTLQSAGTTGLAKGEIGYGVTMERIPQGEAIKEGDVVITSGLGGDMPKGLILGKIETLNTKENSLFITADVRPSADLRNLFRLLIIKK